MALFERFLLLIVLVLTLGVGLFLASNIPQSSLFTVLEPLPGPFDLLSQSDKPLVAPFSEIIAKLSMIPNMKKEIPLIAVVIENHEGARPHQKGLDDALMIQEHIVEGLISRFVVLFNAQKLPKIVGPVRSLRNYFIDALLPHTNVIIHAGGSPDALYRTAGDEGIFAINGLYYDHSTDTDEFIRIDGIAAPHNLFTGEEYIKDLLPKWIKPTQWPPYETGKVQSETGATAIKINFFNPSHNVQYKYFSGSRRYERTNGGIISEAHPRNVLILEVPVLGEKEYGRLDIDMQGRGRLVLFQSGKIVEGRWSKEAPKKAHVFTTLDGDPLNFASGQTWMTVLPSISRVDWE
ncbi:DUF3048 domain-containing protein [Patescibacteria group bacterium]|nr:DUF3048 domain-containing protein [Patescibacteria group bacterium]